MKSCVGVSKTQRLAQNTERVRLLENWWYSFIKHEGSVDQNSQSLFALINGDLDLPWTADAGLQPSFQSTCFSKFPSFTLILHPNWALPGAVTSQIRPWLRQLKTHPCHATGNRACHRNPRYILESKLPLLKMNLYMWMLSKRWNCPSQSSLEL